MSYKDGQDEPAKDPIVAICMDCDAEFTQKEIEGVQECPKCKSKAVPKDPGNDVTIKINTHELRILGMWAEMHARVVDKMHKDDPEWSNMQRTVDKIAQRIEAQLDPSKWTPITFTRELRTIKEEFPKSDIILLDGEGNQEEI